MESMLPIQIAALLHMNGTIWAQMGYLYKFTSNMLGLLLGMETDLVVVKNCNQIRNLQHLKWEKRRNWVRTEENGISQCGPGGI